MKHVPLTVVLVLLCAACHTDPAPTPSPTPDAPPAPPAASAPMAVSPDDGSDPADAMRRTYDNLVLDASKTGPASTIKAASSAGPQLSPEPSRPVGRPMMVGKNLAVDITVSFVRETDRSVQSEPREVCHGILRRLRDDRWVWTAALDIPGANTTRVHFDTFALAEGIELYLYNADDRTVFGPYTGAGPDGSGEFWSNSVKGPRAYLELRSRGPVTNEALRSTHFRIVDLAAINLPIASGR